MFDSGVGGLSVARAVRGLMPTIPLVYVGDSAWFPYGSRRPEELEARTKAITRFLLDKGAEVVVVACNTASGAAIEALRATFDVPFVGVEPAVKVAADAGRYSRVGVLCTETTAAGPRYQRLVERFSDGLEIVTSPSRILAGMVERGEDLDHGSDPLLMDELADLSRSGVQAVVLGCTHYAFLRDRISDLTGLDVLEPSDAVARQVRRVYPGDVPAVGSVEVMEVFTTGDVAEMERFIEMRDLGPARVQHLTL